MITLFGNDNVTGRGNNNKNANTTPGAIVSIHLAKCGDDYSNDNDKLVESFESTANDQRTNDDSDPPCVLASVVNSEFENDNSDDNVKTSDDGNDGDNNDNNNTTPTSGNNDEEIPEKDHPEPSTSSDDTTPNNDDTDLSTLANEAHAWSHLVVSDDDVDDDPGDFDEFCSDYDLDDDGVFDNNDIHKEEGFCCMTVTNSWDPHVDNEYEDDDILLRHGVFDTGGSPSIYLNFFHGTLNNNIGHPYTNNKPISETNVLHYALLKSSMRIHGGDIMKSIKHYNALWCKFQWIGIHNSTNYFGFDSSNSLQLLISSHDLSMLYPSTIEFINLELIFVSQIQQSFFCNIIKEVCNIDTDTYNEELENNSNVNLEQICLQNANLQQKSFPNKWINIVMQKLTRVGIKHPSKQKDYIIINKTLDPRLKNAGDSGFHQTTQQGVLYLIN